MERVERVNYEHTHGWIVLIERRDQRRDCTAVPDLSERPRHNRLRLRIVEKGHEEIDSEWIATAKVLHREFGGGFALLALPTRSGEHELVAGSLLLRRLQNVPRHRRERHSV